jgi:hypothetical protein
MGSRRGDPCCAHVVCEKNTNTDTGANTQKLQENSICLFTHCVACVCTMSFLASKSSNLKISIKIKINNKNLHRY